MIGWMQDIWLAKQNRDHEKVLLQRATCPACEREGTKANTLAGMFMCIACWAPITNYMWRWEPLPMLILNKELGSTSAVPDSTGSKSQRRDGDGDTSGEAAAKQRNIAPVQATRAGPACTGVAQAQAIIAAMITVVDAAPSEPAVQVQTAAKDRKDRYEAEQRAAKELREGPQGIKHKRVGRQLKPTPDYTELHRNARRFKDHRMKWNDPGPAGAAL